MIQVLPQQLERFALEDPLPDWVDVMGAEHLAIELRLGPTHFCIAHSDLPPLQSRATIESRLGPVPAAGNAETYRQLLKINQRWAATQPVGFGIDPQCGQFVFSSLLDIASSGPRDLADALEGGARVALMCRMGRLLGDADAPASATTPWPNGRSDFARA